MVIQKSREGYYGTFSDLCTTLCRDSRIEQKRVQEVIAQIPKAPQNPNRVVCSEVIAGR